MFNFGKSVNKILIPDLSEQAVNIEKVNKETTSGMVISKVFTR